MCANLINSTITDGSDKRDNIYIVLVTMWRFSLVSIQFIRTSNPLFIRGSSFGGSAAYNRPRSSPQSHAPKHTSLFIRIRLDNGLEIFQVTFPHSTYTSTNDGVTLIITGTFMVGDRQPMMDDGGGASGQVQINEEKKYLPNVLLFWRLYISMQDRRWTRRCVSAWYFLRKSFSDSVEPRRSFRSYGWSGMTTNRVVLVGYFSPRWALLRA